MSEKSSPKDQSISLYKSVSASYSLLIPFIILFIVDIILISVLYLSPRYPLSVLFAPPIRKLWGSQFLHYPMNFMLLPKLFYYARLVSSFYFWSLFNGCFYMST